MHCLQVKPKPEPQNPFQTKILTGKIYLMGRRSKVDKASAYGAKGRWFETALRLFFGSRANSSEDFLSSLTYLEQTRVKKDASKFA